eukprot:m.70104 g.70104  ORF g.70104 m.70104 type:complete len:542 (-) comp14155_c0_seq1:105-1730(-)
MSDVHCNANLAHQAPELALPSASMAVARDDSGISYTPPVATEHTRPLPMPAFGAVPPALTKPASTVPVMQPPATSFSAVNPSSIGPQLIPPPPPPPPNPLTGHVPLTSSQFANTTDRQLQAALQQVLWYHQYINWLGAMNQLQQQAAAAAYQQQQLQQLQQLQTTGSPNPNQSGGPLPFARSASMVPQGSSPHPAVVNASVRPATTMQSAASTGVQPAGSGLLPSPAFPLWPGGFTAPINPYHPSHTLPPPAAMPQQISPPLDSAGNSILGPSPHHYSLPSPLPSPFLQAWQPTMSPPAQSPLLSRGPSASKRSAQVTQTPDQTSNTPARKRPKASHQSRSQTQPSLETIQGCGVEGQSWISLAQLCEMDDWSISKCTRHIPCHRPKGSLAWVINWVKGLELPAEQDNDAYEQQRLEAAMPRSDAFTPSYAPSSTSFPQQSVSSGRRGTTSALKRSTSATLKASVTQLAKREKHRELLRDTSHLNDNIERLNNKATKLQRRVDRLQAKVWSRYAKTRPALCGPATSSALLQDTTPSTTVVT